MTTLRLTSAARDRLVRLAIELITLPEHEAAQASARAAFEKALRKKAEALFPKKDMLILKKYGEATADECIRFAPLTGSRHVRTHILPSGAGILLPDCRTLALDEAETVLSEALEAADDAWDKARRAKLADYRALIEGSRTLEQVSVVWPEAEQLRSAFGGNAISVLSDDVVERIRADVATRVLEPA